jgi:hypothetical protein
VQLTERITKLETWQAAGQSHPLTDAPLEEQLEREPFSPNLAMRIELGQTFERLLADAGAMNLAGRFVSPIQQEQKLLIRLIALR